MFYTNGTWSGKFNYNVELVELITFTVDGASYQAEEGMTWGEWLQSNYAAEGWHAYLAGTTQSGVDYYYIRNNIAELLKTDDGFFPITTDEVAPESYGYTFTN